LPGPRALVWSVLDGHVPVAIPRPAPGPDRRETVMNVPARMLASLLLVLLLVPTAFAQNLPKAATPEEVGLSTARLDVLRAALRDHVAHKHIAGALGLIVRNGKIAYLDAVGMADIEAATPAAPDTLFPAAPTTEP